MFVFTNPLPGRFGRTCPRGRVDLATKVRKGLTTLQLHRLGNRLPNVFGLGVAKRVETITSDVHHSNGFRLGTRAKGLSFILDVLPRSRQSHCGLPMVGLGKRTALRGRRCHTSLLLARNRNGIKLATHCGPMRTSCLTSLGVSDLGPAGFLPGSSLCRLTTSFHTRKGKCSPFRISA